MPLTCGQRTYSNTLEYFEPFVINKYSLSLKYDANEDLPKPLQFHVRLFLYTLVQLRKIQSVETVANILVELGHIDVEFEGKGWDCTMKVCMIFFIDIVWQHSEGYKRN